MAAHDMDPGQAETATMDWRITEGSAPSPANDPSSRCDGAREEHKWPAAVDGRTFQLINPETMDQHVEHVEPAAALGTIQDILSILNTLVVNRRPDSDISNTGTSGHNHSGPGSNTELESETEIHPEDSAVEEDSDSDFSQLSMPSLPKEHPTTYTYEWVTKNRIKYPELSKGADLNPRMYTPTFLHDCLMLPGSLAQLLDRESSNIFIERMTPALLPGFQTKVHAFTQQPCLLQSQDPKDCAQGVVILGQGSIVRNLIHKHYRKHCRRIKVEVEVEVQVPDPPSDGWILRRKKIWAHAWLWSKVTSWDVEDGMTWTIEQYLAGKLGGNQKYRTGWTGFIGEDYEGGDAEIEDDDDETVGEGSAMAQSTSSTQWEDSAPVAVDDDSGPRHERQGSVVDWTW